MPAPPLRSPMPAVASGALPVGPCDVREPYPPSGCGPSAARSHPGAARGEAAWDSRAGRPWTSRRASSRLRQPQPPVEHPSVPAREYRWVWQSPRWRAGGFPACRGGWLDTAQRRCMPLAGTAPWPGRDGQAPVQRARNWAGAAREGVGVAGVTECHGTGRALPGPRPALPRTRTIRAVQCDGGGIVPPVTHDSAAFPRDFRTDLQAGTQRWARSLAATIISCPPDADDGGCGRRFPVMSKGNACRW